MYKTSVCVVLVYLQITVCFKNDIFHEGSGIRFSSSANFAYFGYSVILKNETLLVGAPKASRLRRSVTGLVFTCPVTFASLHQKNVTCNPIPLDEDRMRRRLPSNFFRDDMWFGATIAALPNDKLFVCAPRWADPYGNKHLLANGACYGHTKRRDLELTPLKDPSNYAFVADGKRKEYGEYGTHLNFFAYGQAGMSIKVTDLNSIIIGAPGLLQWTGGIIDYRFSNDQDSTFFNLQDVHNPYFTKDMGPDDYFGYSVESGIFETNGSTLYVAGAPRSKMGYGQVLLFNPSVQKRQPLDIKASLHGPQLGSYFGASLCVTDLNGDGAQDILVGAPNFVKKDGSVPYDQGAVFVYLSNNNGPKFVLKSFGSVAGSGKSGARFGSAIADMGDIDGDGYMDVAIGAPMEDNGVGAVYIYKGSSTGLAKQHAQRIVSNDARGFGISIAKGFDIDRNFCNDIAIGAHNSDTAYLYRCVPTIEVHTIIIVPNAMNLPEKATNFTAVFCVDVPNVLHHSPSLVADIFAEITVDPEGNRAMLTGDVKYPVKAKPGEKLCDERVVEVKPTADLSKPINMIFELHETSLDSSVFPTNKARLSERSTLKSSFLIQLMRDCGDDMICKPWLMMSLEPFQRQYTPGTKDKLGAVLTVFNKEEPAYGAKVNLTLPLPPKRVPAACTLVELNMTCNVPGPLERGSSIQWIIELEYAQNTTIDKFIMIKSELHDPLYYRNITDEAVKEIAILITPKANFTVSGNSLPNATIGVSREKLYAGDDVKFIHSFEISNLGPSDWTKLAVVIELPENTTLSNTIKGCTRNMSNLDCYWSVPAKVSIPVSLNLQYDLKTYGDYLDEATFYNATTIVTLLLEDHNKTMMTSTNLVLEPAFQIWPIIVGSVAGLLLLAAIVYGLYKYGFFSRSSRDELKKLQEESIEPEPSFPPMTADSSTLELLSEDSD